MTPLAPAEEPSTMCSLIITESNPASSASRAQRTSTGRSRALVMVQFSLRIRHIRGAAMTVLSGAGPPRAGRAAGHRGLTPGQRLAARGANAPELPVAAERGGPHLLAFGRLRAYLAWHRQRPGHDVVAQPAEPVDLDLDDVPWLDRAGAGRGSRQQDVPRVQRDGAGDVGDEVVHVPV